MIQKRPYGEMSLQKPKIFIIWTFIEKVCRSLKIQLCVFPREKEKFGERRWPTQGHLDALVPVPWLARCLSLLDGAELEEVVPRLRVGSASTSQHETHLHPRTQEGPEQRTRRKEKALRRGWSPPSGWEEGGSSHTTLFHIISEISSLGHNVMLSPWHLTELIQETPFKKHHWIMCKSLFKDIGHYVTQWSLIRINYVIHLSQDLMTGKWCPSRWTSTGFKIRQRIL